MKKTIKKKWLIVLCVVALLLLSVITIIHISNKYFGDFELKNKHSFSEIIDTKFSLDDNEKKNIYQFLDSKLIETSELMGFKTDVIDGNLYTLNSILEISNTLNYDDAYEQLTEKIEEIKYININNLDILNVLYYVNICKKLGLKYKQNDIYDCLNRYYDSEFNLFFLNDSSDSLNIKLVLTAMCCKALPGIEKQERFNIIDGVKRAYNNYNFETGRDVTFYNSGADVIYCMSCMNLIDDNLLEQKREWYNYWKDYYENLTIDTSDAELAYVEFYKIARLFEKSYSCDKIQGFYNCITKEFGEDVDLLMINNIIEFVENKANDTANNIIKNMITNEIENLDINAGSIDILETVYGVVLSKNIGYDLNYNKIRRYVDEMYKSIDDLETPFEKANYLYYAIILDEQINDYKITSDIGVLQQFVDDILGGLYYDSEIESDIVSARKIVEIVMDLQIHDCDINISKIQANRIVNGMKKAIDDRDIMESILITDMYILDDALDMGFVNKEMIQSTYTILEKNGGCKAASDNEYVADIYSTYKSYVCFSFLGDYEKLSKQQSFAGGLKTLDGIYRYDEENDFCNIQSILYGNTLIKAEIGGDK